MTTLSFCGCSLYANVLFDGADILAKCFEAIAHRLCLPNPPSYQYKPLPLLTLYYPSLCSATKPDTHQENL